MLTRRTKSAPIASKPTKALVESALRDSAMASDTGTPARPHPIVAGWIAGRHNIRKEALANRIAMGDARARDPGEFTEIENRKHRMYDALFKALERSGGRVASCPTKTRS